MKNSLIFSILFLIISSCAENKTIYTVNLDYHEVAELVQWGMTAQNLILEWVPKISAIFADRNFPQTINLKLQNSEEGIAYADSNNIVVSSHWIKKHPNDIGLIVHEAVHVVQFYPEFEPGWITEGIADYIRWYLYEEKPLDWFPKGEKEKGYEAAYQTTGGFFLWIMENKNSDLILKLNETMKTASYQATIFETLTGSSLDELWAEYWEERENQ